MEQLKKPAPETDIHRGTASQNERILVALKRGEKLTPLSMLRRFGCLRASARIYDLRNDGHAINATIIAVHGKHVAQYAMAQPTAL